MNKNGFDHVHFANVLKNSIGKGREKEANVFVYRKSFILKPILKILPLVLASLLTPSLRKRGLSLAT